jgi:hypothetical protein
VAIWPFKKKKPRYVPTSAEIDAYLDDLRRRHRAGELTRQRYDELRTQPPPPPDARASAAPPLPPPASDAAPLLSPTPPLAPLPAPDSQRAALPTPPPAAVRPDSTLDAPEAARTRAAPAGAGCAVCGREQRLWDRVLFLWQSCDSAGCGKRYCSGCYATLPRVRGGHIADRQCLAGHAISGDEPRSS